MAYIFSLADSYYDAKQRKRLDSPLFNSYLDFLKKMYYYYENDPKLSGLSKPLLYQIKYIYINFNGKFPLAIYSHINELESLSNELPRSLKNKWNLFYKLYFQLTLNL